MTTAAADREIMRNCAPRHGVRDEDPARSRNGTAQLHRINSQHPMG